MAWLRRRKPYDRTRILAQAVRARSRGNARKAVGLLREVLEHEPRNAELHRRIAPLLAATKQLAEAWSSYRIAVGSLVAAGFLDQAVGVLREAGGCLRRERGVWEALAEVELQRARPIDAHRALLDGRRHFRSRRDRPEAVLLLLRARKLAPHDFAANYDLAGLLARSGARVRAAAILEELVANAQGRELRRARSRQLWLAPSPGALWRWVRAQTGRR
jgi:hypothetical protein